MALCTVPGIPSRGRAAETQLSSSTPSTTPSTEPTPPLIDTPPITTAAITWNSKPQPVLDGFTNAQRRAFYGWCGHQHVPENVHGDPGAFPWAKVEAKAKALVGDKPAPKPAPKADAKPTRIQRFLQGGPKYDLSLLDDAVKGGRKGTVEDVRDGIDAQIKRLPKDPDKNSRVNKVRKSAEKDRILRMGALHNAIKAGRTGTVKEVRDTIQDLIKRLPKD